MSGIAWDTKTNTAIRLESLTRTQIDQLPYQARDPRYRDEVGARRMHLWLFSTTRKTRHYIPGPAMNTVRGEHHTVHPTRDQSDIVRAGGSVYWANLNLLQQDLYVPVGAATIHYETQPGELWPPQSHIPLWLTREQDEPRRDWRSSYPHPDPDAELWLLIRVPLAKCAISRTREFLTTPAHPIATAIAAESVREEHRRAAARTADAETHTQRATLERDRDQAAAGRGDGALALDRDTEALNLAAGFAARAAKHRQDSERLRLEDYRLAGQEGELASRGRCGLVARAVRFETRAGLERQRRAVQDQRTSLAQRRAELELVARSAASEATAAHPAAATGRAVSEAARRSETFESLRADAVQRDLAAIDERIRRLRRTIAAYGRDVAPPAPEETDDSVKPEAGS